MIFWETGQPAQSCPRGRSFNSPSDRLYIRTIRHDPHSCNMQGSTVEARLIVGCKELISTYVLTPSEQLNKHTPFSIFQRITGAQSLTRESVTVIRRLRFSPVRKKRPKNKRVYTYEVLRRKALYQPWGEHVNKSWLISPPHFLLFSLSLSVKAICTFLEFPEFCWREERDERFMFV